MSLNENDLNLYGAESITDKPANPVNSPDNARSFPRPMTWTDAPAGSDTLPPDLEAIRNHWERRGKKYGISPSASWVDETMLHREGQILAQYLQDNQRVLDAGCANGYTTIHLARLKNLRLTGIDYASSMVEHARVNLGRAGTLKGSVNFKVGNLLKMDFPDNHFDRVFTKRVLINLGSHQHQKEAIVEAHRVLKPGGLLLVSEVTDQASDNLNRLRQKFGLEIMTPLWHNCYVDEPDFLQFASQYYHLKEVRHFSSTYYVMTWALYPFFVRSGQRNYRGWFHRLAANLPQVGDWGLQKLFVLQKKA